MTSSEHKIDEPEPDYEGFVAGRFKVSHETEDPSIKTPTKDVDTDSVKTEVQDLSFTMEDEQENTNDLQTKQKTNATLPKNVDRGIVPQNRANGDAERAGFSTFHSRPKLDSGKDNLSYEDDDSFEPTLLRTRRAVNANYEAKSNQRQMPVDNGLMANQRASKRPQSLQLDNSSHRSITFDRTVSQPMGSSNGSMVLQLVLPPGVLRGLPQDSLETASNYPTATDLSNNEYFTYSPSVITQGISNKTRNVDTPNGKSNAFGNKYNSSPSLHSEGTSYHGHHPPPSTAEEKTEMFRRYNSIIMSCVYAVFLVSIGIVVYVADVMRSDATLAASFNLFLVLLGFIYLLYLYFDIRAYVRKAKVHLKATTNYDKEDDVQSVDLNMNNIPAPNHHFCFASGRHAGSLYLRIGAAVFCFGHLIHSGLLLVYEVVFLTSEEFGSCFNPVALTFDIIYPIYSFFLLFFIFKYSNVIVNHCKEAARMLFMHTIGASLCFWMWAIFRESVNFLDRYGINDDTDETTTVATTPVAEIEGTTAALSSQGARDIFNFFNTTTTYADECQVTELNMIYELFSPYLYPFTIEYNILIVGILYIIWSNIGNCKRGGGSTAEGVPCPPLDGPEAANNMVIHANCTHANRGLFAGLLVLIGSVVSIILFFIAMTNSEYADIGKAVNTATEIVLVTAMALTSIAAYRQITKLDVNHHPISLLDDVLMFIAIPAFFLYAIFTLIPAAMNDDWLTIVANVLVVTQVLIQTPLIIDGLRRCSNSRKLRNKTPGRELITFLLICNVALWINETFEIKSTDKKDDRYEYYGIVLWTILKHMTIPLTMFYRFHSSVCLADIWKSAYSPGEFDHH